MPHATAPRLASAQPDVARQPNLAKVAVGVPVVVEPIEISDMGGIVALPVLLQRVTPAGTVQLSAVSASLTHAQRERPRGPRVGATKSENAGRWR